MKKHPLDQLRGAFNAIVLISCARCSKNEELGIINFFFGFSAIPKMASFSRPYPPIISYPGSLRPTVSTSSAFSANWRYDSQTHQLQTFIPTPSPGPRIITLPPSSGPVKQASSSTWSSSSSGSFDSIKQQTPSPSWFAIAHSVSPQPLVFPSPWSSPTAVPRSWGSADSIKQAPPSARPPPFAVRCAPPSNDGPLLPSAELTQNLPSQFNLISQGTAGLFRCDCQRMMLIYAGHVVKEAYSEWARNRLKSRPHARFWIAHVEGPLTYVYIDCVNSSNLGRRKVEWFDYRVEATGVILRPFVYGIDGRRAWIKAVDFFIEEDQDKCHKDLIRMVDEEEQKLEEPFPTEDHWLGISLNQPWQRETLQFLQSDLPTKSSMAPIFNVHSEYIQLSMMDFWKWMLIHHPSDTLVFEHGISTKKGVRNEIKKATDRGCTHKFIIVMLPNIDSHIPWGPRSKILQDLRNGRGLSRVPNGIVILSTKPISFGSLVNSGIACAGLPDARDDLKRLWTVTSVKITDPQPTKTAVQIAGERLVREIKGQPASSSDASEESDEYSDYESDDDN